MEVGVKLGLKKEDLATQSLAALCSQGVAVFLPQQNTGGLSPGEDRTECFWTGGLRAQLRTELATTLKTEGLNVYKLGIEIPPSPTILVTLKH